MRIKTLILVTFVAMAGLVACGGRQYTRGKYVDPEAENLLSDKFVESDLQKIARDLSGSLLHDPSVKDASKAPVVMVSLFTNGTDEHIDMQSLTNKIRTELAQSKKVSFINERLRETLAEEYDYEESGFVDPALAKKRGHQWGVDYLVSGHVASIRQPVGKREVVYYKTTMELTNLETGAIAWTDEVEIKKTFKKHYVGK
jgi:uncharacterized protein (TIGR02722 family)